MDNEILKRLNSASAEQRLAELKAVISNEKEKPPVLNEYANNHIHTKYSFSPYSPTAAVFFARQAGLATAGIMDHDSISGAREFIEAGKTAGVATTIGLECRVSLAGTPLEGKRVNNPDQKSVAYMALHGVPHQNIEYLNDFFAPLREKRNIRNKKMVENINALVSGNGITLDFEKDVIPLSNYSEGGSVTERHILYALALKIAKKYPRNTAAFLENELGVPLSEKQKNQMNDTRSGYFTYDLLGILKGAFIKKIYVDADEELLHISELSALAKKIDALLCYAYLGDVTNSVTGDKIAQKFEDDYLEELFEILRHQNVDAVTYMPSRNTPEQLKRVMELCKKFGFFEISGEDINSPRQSFICGELAKPEFSHLIKATWTLIEREKELSTDY
ncbi:MAG: PHP domain-containing protein [Clostridia bacterium]|nr:PHP domain-containing protein [Clostridia bacterium]